MCQTSIQMMRKPRKQHTISLPFGSWNLSVSHSIVSNSCDPMDYSQAPLSMGFSRQEYWSGLPFLPPRIFPTQESKLGFLLCTQILYQLRYDQPLIHIGLAKSSFRFFCKMVWKNPNKIFGQPSTNMIPFLKLSVWKLSM